MKGWRNRAVGRWIAVAGPAGLCWWLGLRTGTAQTTETDGAEGPDIQAERPETPGAGGDSTAAG